jgi:hypothetical protein
MWLIPKVTRHESRFADIVENKSTEGINNCPRVLSLKGKCVRRPKPVIAIASQHIEIVDVGAPECWLKIKRHLVPCRNSRFYKSSNNRKVFKPNRNSWKGSKHLKPKSDQSGGTSMVHQLLPKTTGSFL